MDFTYDGYKALLHLLNLHGYLCTDYHEAEFPDDKKRVILRHDIDNDIKKALQLARLENELGWKSTYFVMVTNNFYNVFSRKNIEMLKEIISLGHEVGLHFDEVAYDFDESKKMKQIQAKVLNEAKLLEIAIGSSVSTVSMHRPSKEMLEANCRFYGLINSYSKRFLGGEYKYISDSRRRWRESVDDIISYEKFMKLHILTHAFWYNDNEKTLQESVLNYVNSGNLDRYYNFCENITNIEEIMTLEEVK